MADQDRLDVEQIKYDHFDAIMTREVIVLVKADYGWDVEHWLPDGVSPTTSYDTPQEAAGRALQLMGLKEPIEPQNWPEPVEIGTIERNAGETMSDDNVIKMPEKSKAHLDGMLVGPFEQWHVVISGRRIPRLTGFKREDGKILLYVDNRFGGGPFEPEEAYQAAYLIAQATAIAEGYSNLEAEEKGRCFAPQMVNLGSTDGDAPKSE